MKFLFKFADDSSAPNLSGKVEIAADRGYISTEVGNLVRACNVQESVGFRTDNNAACARLLIYVAIAFHRGKQLFHAKRELTFYPSLAHAHHANNERAAMYDSLLHLSDTLLGMARKSQLKTPKVGLNGMGGETVQLNVSTSVTSSEMTRQHSNQTPSPVEMPSLGRGKAREVITEFGECVIGVRAGGRITSVLAVGDISVLEGPSTNGKKEDTKQPRYLTVSTPDLRKNSGSDTARTRKSRRVSSSDPNFA
ncbi:hypothetical protein THAOC_29524 [Thalassiosira oceanica]|uniref:Uncharacterized protein n=1 Tax=Thalassiosira oceanica TaxID=159749 RepID=K0RG89_THAOC|nr:hypothetical protein THAOC_29524 [Thalassiosira oceanica]|eukprot:EJK51314.1 hypothetical protein THAOC_29524 [Thalassiosira oceanica]